MRRPGSRYLRSGDVSVPEALKRYDVRDDDCSNDLPCLEIPGLDGVIERAARQLVLAETGQTTDRLRVSEELTNHSAGLRVPKLYTNA